MFYRYPPSLTELINQLGKLPGVGPKTAARLAFHLLAAPEADAAGLAAAIGAARKSIGYCAICGSYTDTEVCPLCEDSERDATLLCVVEQPRDIISMERSRSFRGRYHVLNGVLSPMDGIGPDRLRMTELFRRLENGGIREVVVATNPSVEGEATAMYLAKKIKPMGIRVTRIAHGLPVGGDLEYADEATLSLALSGRHDL
ncbi:MAG: recombination protein RecR [Firmicutes bacterium]|nr:recombination protein RecR [Bacillota bacterium]MBQ3112177.1 recombination protein RecR [Bacillota bacterium]MBQ6842718.1 recombination protein RecR [Bacillota bacterium]MBR7113650.1 recombination protein RecR [Bacillota bacterium]